MTQRPFHLTKTRLNKLSAVYSQIAQILFGSVAIPFLLDKFDPFLVLLGLTGALVFWIMSVFMVK